MPHFRFDLYREPMRADWKKSESQNLMGAESGSLFCKQRKG